MKLTINDKDYTFEFSIAASLCDTCVEKMTKLLFGLAGAEEDADISKLMQTMTDIYGTTFALFYGGLLEHHSNEIKSEKDAKRLLADYFKENPDREKYNFYTLFTMLLEQVKEDGFFDLLGLNSMLGDMVSEQPETKTRERKKADTVVSEN